MKKLVFILMSFMSFIFVGKSQIMSGSKIYLLTRTGYYVNCTSGTGNISAYNGHSDNPDVSDEIFTIQNINGSTSISSGDKVYLLTRTGYYVNCTNGTGNISAYNGHSDNPDISDEIFTIEKINGGGNIRSEDKIYLKTRTGYYVNCTSGTGNISAYNGHSDNPDVSDEIFTIREVRSNPILTVSQQIFQTEVQITIRISGATPNSDVNINVNNVPATANQSCRIRTNHEGVGSCILRYPYTVSICSLTTEQQRQRGTITATNSNGSSLAITEFYFGSIYSRPVGGVCSKNLVVEVVTGGDDLRGRSQAYLTVHYSNGRPSPEYRLNNGANWGNNSTNTVTIGLDPGVLTAEGIVGITITVDGEPRSWSDSYDNWNLDKLKVTFDGNLLWSLSGTPLVRFKGDLREQRWNR